MASEDSSILHTHPAFITERTCPHEWSPSFPKDLMKSLYRGWHWNVTQRHCSLLDIISPQEVSLHPRWLPALAWTNYTAFHFAKTQWCSNLKPLSPLIARTWDPCPLSPSSHNRKSLNGAAVAHALSYSIQCLWHWRQGASNQTPPPPLQFSMYHLLSGR